MKHKLLILFASLLALATLGTAQDQPSAKSQERIIKEVRHELLMLPYFGVFDYIAFKVDGSTVTLLGEVVRPTLKSDAENVVKHIEGVEKVNNQIEVLPPSPMDDRLRLELFRAIYQYPLVAEVRTRRAEADPNHRQEWPRDPGRSRGQRSAIRILPASAPMAFPASSR